MPQMQHMNRVFRWAAGICACALIFPCLAAAPKKAESAAAKKATERLPEDLTVKATPYVVNCQPPKAGTCVIRKPVDTGYRVLTNGVDLEDKGDRWIADFGKAPYASSPKGLLRVMGQNGDLHEITVHFGNPPAAKPAAPQK